MKSAHINTVLKEVFGYEKFRPLQEQVISRVLGKRDTLVIMPTGGGKSLCYQIPALIFDGLTVVISPLISLMKDQVEQLASFGVTAVCLNSSIPAWTYHQNVEIIKSGEAKLLYMAPETLLKRSTRRLLSQLNVQCFTIDEAHCISEWGHDFRPEYRQIAQLRSDFPDAVSLALTATATPRVRNDIEKNLQLDDSETFIASFDRKNLFLEIVEKQNPLAQTLDFLENHRGQSGIIYCFSRRQVDELYEDLSMHGYSVKPYHAGLSESVRTKNQDSFIKDDTAIMVATIAFGMGINKPDVRFVMHYDLPQNIESYYQQIGRAGRDGLRADCLMLFGYSDIGKINYIINQKSPNEQQVARRHLEDLLDFIEFDQCRRIPLMDYFGETYTDVDCEMCDNCLSDIEGKEDLTVPAQKFLSCIVRTGQRFGMGHIIRVLRGSKAKKVIQYRHEMLTTYGIGRELTRKQWTRVAHLLLRKGYLFKEKKHGILKIKPLSDNLLKGKAILLGNIGEKKSVSGSGISSPGLSGNTLRYDEPLFEKLRNERKRLADKEQIPPYAIFPDTTLMEMAYYFPQRPESLLNLYGIGTAKRKKYGDSFLKVIVEYCERNGLKERQKPLRTRRPDTFRRRHQQVGDAFNNGHSIMQLAHEYDVKQGTIINNLEKYQQEGHILRQDGITEASSLSDPVRCKVIEAFEKEGSEILRPVYEALDKAVSYDELRLVRLIYQSKLNN